VFDPCAHKRYFPLLPLLAESIKRTASFVLSRVCCVTAVWHREMQSVVLCGLQSYKRIRTETWWQPVKIFREFRCPSGGGSGSTVFPQLIFRRFRKLGKNDYYFRHVCPSVHPDGTTRLLRNGFSWNLIFDFFFRKSAEKIQVTLKSDKNNGYFTWRPVYNYYNISLSSS
jgi:hypothetical protein